MPGPFATALLLLFLRAMAATQELLGKVKKDSIFTQSAALSYYTALSLAPLLILLVTLLSTLAPDFQVKLLANIRGLVGPEAAQATKMIIDNAKEKPDVRTWAGLFGVLTLLFSASVIFGQLRTTLNQIFEMPPERPPDEKKRAWYYGIWTFARDKLFNMGMVLTFVFISIVSLLISSAISFYFNGTQEIIGQIVNFIVSMTIFTLLFAGIYLFLPTYKIKRRVALMSGFLTALLFTLGKSLIGLYIGESAVGSAYGAAGSLIILLVWVYYSSAIIFFCAEIAQQINQNWKRKQSGVF